MSAPTTRSLSWPATYWSLTAVGGKVHTGRSRNDQVVTDLRLHLRSVCAELATELAGLVTLAAKRATAEATPPTHSRDVAETMPRCG